MCTEYIQIALPLHVVKSRGHHWLQILRDTYCIHIFYPLQSRMLSFEMTSQGSLNRSSVLTVCIGAREGFPQIYFLFMGSLMYFYVIFLPRLVIAPGKAAGPFALLSRHICTRVHSHGKAAGRRTTFSGHSCLNFERSTFGNSLGYQHLVYIYRCTCKNVRSKNKESLSGIFKKTE